MPTAITNQKSFNPRPRAGGDAAADNADALIAEFQSTPPRGGRPESRQAEKFHDRFNPRPRAGGDAAIRLPQKNN